MKASEARKEALEALHDEIYEWIIEATDDGKNRVVIALSRDEYTQEFLESACKTLKKEGFTAEIKPLTPHRERYYDIVVSW